MTDIAASPARPKIPVWRTAYDAYRLGLGAIFSSGKMFRFFVYGSFLCLTALGAHFHVLDNGRLSGFSSLADIQVTSFVILAVTFIVLAVVAAPLGMSIQRHVVLGESPHAAYAGYVATKHGRSFVFATLAVCAIFFAAAVLQIFADDAIYEMNATGWDAVARTPGFTSSLIVLAAQLVSYTIAALFAARLFFAFPAIACDRLGASLAQSIRETNGTAWRLFFVIVIVVTPYLVISFFSLLTASTIVALNYRSEGLLPTGQDIAAEMMSSTPFFVALGIIFIGSMTTFVAIAAGAARAYQIRVERGLSGVAEVFS
jgi:hypothetical protein